MIAALRAIRAQHPAKLIAAMTVVAPVLLEQIVHEADETVYLAAPDFFSGVEQFFEELSPVLEEEVVTILQQSRCTPEGGAASVAACSS
jgi:predicted phosphoribosyltransferase